MSQRGIELILATHNLHKIREFKAMLAPFSKFEVLSLKGFSDYTLPEETGSAFEENARLKAIDAAKKLGRWTFADDSGLVVPALSGSPGVYSARYAGVGATDKDNRKKLLEEMEGLKDLARSAYYECWIILASPEGEVHAGKGVCEGQILEKEIGSNGFGYDPLFVAYDYRKSFAELDESVKNRVSHRRKAFDRILPYLESISPP